MDERYLWTLCNVWHVCWIMYWLFVDRLSRPVVVLDRLPGLYGLKYDSATACGLPLYLCSYKLVGSVTSTIRCIQNDFWAYGMSSTNHAPILHRHHHYLQTEGSEIPHDPRHLGVPSGASKTISVPMVRSTQTVHLSCLKISTIYKRTELTSASPPRSTVGCVQNDLWAYGMSTTNHAPILPRH